MKSSSRNRKTVRLLALHTTEGILRNGDLRSFFNRSNAQGSSHASADDSGNYDDSGFVPYDRAAWTLRSGNSVSENIEICGFARWTRQEWLTTHRNRIVAAAKWLAVRSKARNIPLVYLTHDQLRAGHSGVIQHNDWTIAMKDGTHWDCGPGFPIDVVIEMARTFAGEDALMAVSESEFRELARKVDVIFAQLTGDTGNGEWGWPTWRYSENNERLTVVDYLRSLDREFRSAFTLDNRPGGDSDSAVGHILSERAEVRELLTRILDRLA